MTAVSSGKSGEENPRSRRSEVRRLPKRAHYDRTTRDAILDEGLVCHVGLEAEGHPVVIPMAYARDGERLILHGSVASRLARSLSRGAEVCVAVTLVDGLVLARSTFHHSMNYRSVVIFGRAKVIEDETEKRRALDLLTEHLVPGRSAEARGPNPEELAATAVLEVPLEEASAKIRTGPPSDNKEDLQLDVWAGVLPLRLVSDSPIAAPDLAGELEVPEYVRRYRRSAGASGDAGS